MKSLDINNPDHHRAIGVAYGMSAFKSTEPPEGVPRSEQQLRRAALDLALALGLIEVNTMPMWWTLTTEQMTGWMDFARERIERGAPNPRTSAGGGNG